MFGLSLLRTSRLRDLAFRADNGERIARDVHQALLAYCLQCDLARMNDQPLCRRCLGIAVALQEIG